MVRNIFESVGSLTPECRNSTNDHIDIGVVLIQSHPNRSTASRSTDILRRPCVRVMMEFNPMYLSVMTMLLPSSIREIVEYHDLIELFNRHSLDGDIWVDLVLQ